MTFKGRNMVDIKQSNRAAILTLLHEQGGMSRKQIAARLNLTPAAITMIVSDMITDNILCEVKVIEGLGAAGRKEIMIDIHSDIFFAVGVYYSVERAIISVTDLRGNLLSSERFIYDFNSGAEFVISKICDILNKTIRHFELQGKRCVGIGVSARGIVDETTGICVNSYGGWPQQNVNVLEAMKKKLTYERIYIHQNVRALASAYLFLNRSEVIESLLFIKNDTGIGSALVINHQVHTGYSSNAGEIGHITITPLGGKSCRCGGIGCLETIASCKSIENDVMEIYDAERTPFLYKITEGNREHVVFETIMDAVNMGDVEVENIVMHAIKLLANVLRMHIGILDVQKLVLNGKVFYHPFFYQQLLQNINFDNRLNSLENIIATTESMGDLDALCSPILAIKAFYNDGGTIKQ